MLGKCGERVDGRTGGQADKWTSGRVDGRTSGQVDKRTSGRADGRTGGQADKRTGGRVDGRTGGRVDSGVQEESQFIIIFFPRGVMIDSGWNWTPVMGSVLWDRAMMVPSGVIARVSRQVGRVSGFTAHEW